MLKRTIEKYVLPAAAAAAAPAASGTAGTTAAAGGGAAGGGGGAAGGAARAGAAGEVAKGMPKGGAGMDPGSAIRTAGAQTAGFVNAFSSIPESAGGRYRADLERVKAQRYAEPGPYHEDGPSHWTDKNGVPNLNFAWAKKHYGKMPDESLRWHIKDAQEAMRANPNNPKNGAYADVVNVAAQILKERQKTGKSVSFPAIPDRPGHGSLNVSVGGSAGGVA